MKIHKDLKGRIRKYFGALKSVPPKLRGFIDDINNDYYRISERTDDTLGDANLFRLLSRNVTDVIWTMDLLLRLQYVTPSCRVLTGYTPDELLKMTLEEFVTPETLKLCYTTLLRELDNQRTGGQDWRRPVFLDCQFRRKDSTLIWAEIRVAFIMEGNRPKGIIGVCRDISARREMEERLRQSEEQYRSILETIEDGYYEVDLAGRYVFFNSAFCRMIGYTPDELMGMSFRQIVPEESHKKIFKLYNKLYTEGVQERLTRSRYIRKDGVVRHAEGSISLRFDSEGNKIGFCGIIRDITDKIAMEDSLRQSEQKWRSLYNSIPGGSFVVDRNRIITDANAITCMIAGYTYGELVGEKCSIICQEDPETCTCPIAGENSEKVDNVESALKTKDGRIIPIIKSAHRMRSGEEEMVLANFHDISRMKEIEEALRTSEESLRKRNDAIEKDLLTAQLIQRSLLSVNLPKLEWVKVDYRYLPLDAVGGDYFSLTQLREGGMGVFIGDVSSHGVTAALFLSLVKATSERICRDHALQPLQFVNMLNAELYNNMPLSFLTATYGVFGVSCNGVTPFTFSSAGHPYPILFRADAGTAEYVRCKGTLIGMFEQLDFHETTVHLMKGDRIFLYTDGIPETVNEKKDLIGYERLPELIRDCNSESLEETLDNIIGEINAFRGGAGLCDDIVLLGFEVIG
ncbi:MAG: PAS domain S-box protein [Spirochaetes bacterium]|nr:PAS domain S-box protein [Spirochaetota bacterium]